jgi:hypothetical protein
VTEEEGIRVEVTRDKGDYISGVFANLMASGGLLTPAIIAIALVFLLLLESALEGGDLSVSFAVFMGVIVFAAVFFFSCASVMFAAWRSWKAPDALRPLIYVFTRDQLSVKSDLGGSETKWELWKDAFENDRVLIVRHRLNIIHILPKRQIAAETLARLKALLRDVLGGRVRFKSAPGPA